MHLQGLVNGQIFKKHRKLKMLAGTGAGRNLLQNEHIARSGKKKKKKNTNVIDSTAKEMNVILVRVYGTSITSKV